MPLTDKQLYRVIDDVNSYYRITSESKKELLLNKYPNAAAAYSLRLLDGYYRGPLVRIRRDSDDGVEVDVYPDYNNELSLDSLVSNVAVHTTNDGIEDTDATFLKSLQSLGEFVSNPNYVDNGTAVDATVCVWYDQSSTDGVPNDNDASQVTATQQPLIVSSGVIVTENEKPAVDFNSTSHVLPLQVHGHSAATIFETLQTSDTLLINYSGQAGPYYSWVAHSGDTNTTVYNNFGTPSMFVDGSAVSILNRGDVHTATATGSQILRTTTNANTSAWTQSKYSGFGTYEFIGTLQEFIVYNSDQSANRTDVEEDINSFYQIDGYTPTPKLIDLTQDLAVQNGGTIADGTPAAAYSLRLLSSTYNGPLVRIRRTIDNTEVDVYPDSDGEFSIYSTIEDGGTELTTGVTGGSTDKTTLHEFLYGQDTDCMVVVWYDQAGSNDATQTTTGSQPRIYISDTGVILDNGLPAMSFDGADDDLQASSWFNSVGYGIIFGVHRQFSQTSQRNVFIDRVESTGFTRAALYYNASSNTGVSIGGRRISSDSFQIVGNQSWDGGQLLTSSFFKWADALLESYVNGSSNGTLNPFQTAGNTNVSEFGSVVGSGFSSLRLNGRIQELVIYTSDQSTNRTGIESNINDYYSIYP